MKYAQPEKEKKYIQLNEGETAKLKIEQKDELKSKTQSQIKESPFLNTLISFLFSFLFFWKSFSNFISRKKEMKEKKQRTQLEKNCHLENENISRKYLNKKKEKVNSKYMISYKNYIKNIINIIEILSLVRRIFLNNQLYLFVSKFSNITLRIAGIGNSTIFGPPSKFNRSYYPNMIYINGEEKLDINFYYIFNESVNNVTLIWNNSLDNCQNMFNGCSNITSIDLSHFDSSRVTNMRSMFQSCSNLFVINLYNLVTSNVKDMGYMFSGCKSLNPLDLTSFETSKVTRMDFMFGIV